MTEVKKALAKQFEVKDMGELHYFFGKLHYFLEKSGLVSQHMPKASCRNLGCKRQKQ